MAILAFNGFDNEDVGNGWALSTTGRDSFVTGRLNSGKALRLSYASGDVFSSQTFSHDITTNQMIIGGAFRFDRFSSGSNNFLQVKDSNTSWLKLGTPSGALTVYRHTAQAGGTAIATGPTLRADKWYYIEFQLDMKDAGGVAKVWVDGALVIDFTGDTLSSTVGTASTTVYMGTPSFYFQIDIDDVYVLDTTGASPTNAALGPVTVPFLSPDGQTSADFLGSDADSTDNHLLVDELPAQTTDYVESSTSTDTDIYTLGDLPSSAGTPYAVQSGVYGRDTLGGSATLNIGVREGGTSETTAKNMPASDGWVYADPVTDAPSDASAWDSTSVNSLEFYVEVP